MDRPAQMGGPTTMVASARLSGPARGVTVRELTKTHGATTALASVDLDVEPGQVVGLLGPNGAGKTTLVRILSTLSRPDSGRVWVGGRDAMAAPHEVRARIGVAGQSTAIDEILTGRENLVMTARLSGYGRRVASRRAGELLEVFDLHAADRRVQGYSGGMRRRLDLACALVARPQVLILDEPTTGLDPHGRAELWRLVAELVADGAAVLVTTQYLEEADAFADEVVVLVDGRVHTRGAPGQLKRRHGTDVITLDVARPEQLDRAHGVLARPDTTIKIAPPTPRTSTPGTMTLYVDDAGRMLPTILADLDRAGVEVSCVSARTPTLDEVFVRLTTEAGS